jgi:predicted  nucleic acid-binding Zn-ribbon protein
MGILDMLNEIQDNQQYIKKCNTVIKDDSYKNLLKKIKYEFEKEKAEFIIKENNLKKIRESIQDINDNLDNAKKYIDEYESRIYNETIKDYKLIEKIQNEIKSKEYLIKELEDKSLELLEEEEKLQIEKESLRIKLSELKGKFYDCKESANQNVLKAKEDIKEAENNIEKLQKFIPEDLMRQYNNISQIKGTGVAELQNGACSKCKLKVSTITIDNINRHKNIVFCDNCGRILYYNMNN